MSRSSFSKAYYEEIAKLEPMEMTFTIEDADLDKLNDMLKDINVKECPWFEVQDKHGNKAKYYREPRWIPCSERLPKERVKVLACLKDWQTGESKTVVSYRIDYNYWHGYGRYNKECVAWMPLPEPYREVEE